MTFKPSDLEYFYKLKEKKYLLFKNLSKVIIKSRSRLD